MQHMMRFIRLFLLRLKGRRRFDPNGSRFYAPGTSKVARRGHDRGSHSARGSFPSLLSYTEVLKRQKARETLAAHAAKGAQHLLPWED